MPLFWLSFSGQKAQPQILEWRIRASAASDLGFKAHGTLTGILECPKCQILAVDTETTVKLTKRMM